MNLTMVRKIHKATRNVNGMFLDNPVLRFGLALPFVVVAATTLKNALCLAIAMFVTIVPISVISFLFGNKLPQYTHIVIYPIIASGFLIPVRMFIHEIDPVLTDSLGMYISLISVSTLLISQAEHSAMRKRALGSSTVKSICTCVGFAIVICVVGLIREFFAFNTIGGVSLPFNNFKVYGVSLAFFGFIFLGIMIAFARWLKRFIFYNLIKVHNKEA